MLIAISGAQGSGKSTVLNELQKIGFKVVERKTARSVLAEFPVKTLDEIYADPDLVVMWQEEILRRKVNDELEAHESEDLWFTERTYADLFTYACMAVGKNNNKSKWLDEYFEKCKEHQLKFYRHSFYLEHHGVFNVVNDGVRGTNRHYATMIEKSLYAFLEQMTLKNLWINFTTIRDKSTKDRVKKIVTVSLNHYLNNERQEEVF